MYRQTLRQYGFRCRGVYDAHNFKQTQVARGEFLGISLKQRKAKLSDLVDNVVVGSDDNQQGGSWGQQNGKEWNRHLNVSLYR